MRGGDKPPRGPLAAGHLEQCPSKLSCPCGTTIVAEWRVNFQLERLPESSYLATFESIPGLIAQGRTVMNDPRDCP
jgi:hypothetical protein